MSIIQYYHIDSLYIWKYKDIYKESIDTCISRSRCELLSYSLDFFFLACFSYFNYVISSEFYKFLKLYYFIYFNVSDWFFICTNLSFSIANIGYNYHSAHFILMTNNIIDVNIYFFCNRKRFQNRWMYAYCCYWAISHSVLRSKF